MEFDAKPRKKQRITDVYKKFKANTDTSYSSTTTISTTARHGYSPGFV
jgi:hypothetical protein